MRRVLAATATLVLAASVTADAATRHVIRGAGFGHGIGMSQFGAKGLADNGRNYKQIVTHYYQGTDVTSAGSRTVRVLLQSGRSEVQFTEATRAPGKSLSPNRTYRAHARGLSQVELRTAGGKLVGVFDAPLRVSSSAGVLRLRGTTINGIREGQFRNSLEIRPGVFGGLGAVNALPLDEYVKGVVPGEVPASWHMETLKAQALAARSYTLATNRGGDAFDQYPDTRSQVYRGFGGEHPRTNQAVDETRGEIITYRGEVIRAAYYFSTSGGRTENVENVFYNAEPTPYLTSVKDPYDKASPRHRWRFGFTTGQMQAKLSGLVKGRFKRIDVIKRGESPRVVWANVVGTRGSTRVRGATLRTKLGLYDTWLHYSRVRTSARKSAFSPEFVARLLGRRAIVGEIRPVPRSRRIVVERLDRRGRWVKRLTARTTRKGVYRIILRKPGRFRVRAGRVIGPTVRVR
ncbi:MAG TPA: SpoIID/LytB domain-containing protein [Thermoleophilaceae bacterium]|nr:SpoIID/LytB domain-containing protein [Thermoleophilaceae bacterium]